MSNPNEPQQPQYDANTPQYQAPESNQPESGANFAPPVPQPVEDNGQPQPTYPNPQPSQPLHAPQPLQAPQSPQEPQPASASQPAQSYSPAQPYSPTTTPQSDSYGAPQYSTGQYDNPQSNPAYGQPNQSNLPPQGTPYPNAPYPNAPYQGLPQPGVPQYNGYGAGQGEPPLNKPYYGIKFIPAASRFFQKYAVFTGRASKSEFWWAYVALILGNIVLSLLASLISSTTRGWVGTLWTLATIVPLLAISVRRLHDTNKATVWILLPGLPYVLSQLIGWSIQIQGLSPIDSNGHANESYLGSIGIVGILGLISIISGIVLFTSSSNPAGVRFDDDYQPNQFGQPGQYPQSGQYQQQDQYQQPGQYQQPDQQSYPNQQYPQQ